jgi:hypothetical protein
VHSELNGFCGQVLVQFFAFAIGAGAIHALYAFVHTLYAGIAVLSQKASVPCDILQYITHNNTIILRYTIVGFKPNILSDIILLQHIFFEISRKILGLVCTIYTTS